jgi:hypothetical protein
MDDVPLCPVWWPKLIWDLHFVHIPGPPPPNPVNLPPEMDRIFQMLAMHTMTYTLTDQKHAQAMRTQLEESLSHTIKNLSKMHDERHR